MAIHTTRRPLLRLPNRRPILLALTSAGLGAFATVAVIVGWSVLGPDPAANPPGPAAITSFGGAATQPNYPASREGVRGHLAVEETVDPMAAVSTAAQPVYPASREGVRGHVAQD